MVDCADSISQQEDCLLRKRLAAFGYLAREHRYDFIYNVCATSYVDQEALLRYIEGIRPQKAYQGPLGVCQYSGIPYVSGASMLLSAEVAEAMASQRQSIIEENKLGYGDDATIGTWVARNLSNSSLPDIIANIHKGLPATSDSTFVLPNRNGASINLVMSPVEMHQPKKGAYHYQFHSNTSKHMLHFHEHFFT